MLRLAITFPRFLPHVLLLPRACRDGRFDGDIQRWARRHFGHEGTRTGDFVRLMHLFPEFRNLFYLRAGPLSRPWRFLVPPLSSLFLDTDDIGPGFFIQHGFATIVAARRIGAGCWVNQQVTIGYDDAREQPVLEDGVKVHAGAKVIGGIVIGARSIVGANAVVVKNVPPDCTVVGVPARIVRRNGVRVDEPL